MAQINERRTQQWQEYIIVIQMVQRLIAQIVAVMQLLMMMDLYVATQIVLTANAHLNEQPDDAWSKRDSWYCNKNPVVGSRERCKERRRR